MKKIITTTLALLTFLNIMYSQGLTQTLRGNITDIDTELPLIGAQITILDSEPLIGTTSDENGDFRFENIPLGRTSLQLSYLGYENKTIPSIEVKSGKEVVLKLQMQESTIRMEEVIVKANQNPGEALNDMALISARSISAEKTERFAGGFSDPSRIVSAFAGVATSNDGDNDIIVRGNSPKYIQWRLEGVEITNPTHFADQNAARGGISALNNNLLATSDFYTGAFSPEYGDALSGVYDLKLRTGNNEKLEATLGVGLLGTDLTLEGPFKKGYGGSYLLNYRYSTISLISDIGLVDIDGLFNFQDAAFKVVLPTEKMGTFSMFGLGGISSFSLEDVKASLQQTPGDNPMGTDVREDYDKGTSLLNVGINHFLPINNSSYLKTSLSYSSNTIDEEVFETQDSLSPTILDFENRLLQSTYRLALTYNNKINAKNKIQIGTKYSLFGYDYKQSWFQDDIGSRFTLVDFDENVGTLRNFASWKHRVNEDITLVAGIHNMNVLYNKKSTIEPRVALKWQLNPTNSVNIGYGNHSTMESIHNYFAKVENERGEITEPNKDLDLLKANHFVLGYEKRFSSNFSAKVEAYYQHLYNLPVENDNSSHYATINEGLDFRYVDLVNEGTGKNYGVELTLERSFSNSYYFLVNASIFSSKYKSLENIERNTQYNGNYLVNVLFGKEFEKMGKKKNKTLSLNAKVFFGGGKRIIPLLRDTEGNLAVDPTTDRYWDYDKAYQQKLDDVYTVILSASYKINKPKATHEIFINLDNLTNTKAKLSEFYDADAPDSIGHIQQFGFFPNLMYRVYF